MLNTHLPFSVYVIKSEEGRFYIGISSDVKKRLDAHNKGLSKWTRKFKNWKLIYQENYNNYTGARKREIYLKSLKSGRGFYKIIYSGVDPALRDRVAHNPAKRDRWFSAKGASAYGGKSQSN